MAEKTNQNPSDAQGSDTSPDPQFFGGETAPVPPPPQELVELEVGGKKFKLEKSAAEAFSAYQEQHQRDLETRDREIRSLKAPPPPKPVEDEFYTPDLDTKFFEKPSQYLKQVEERAYSRAKKDLTDQYNTVSAERQFYDDFYRENPSIDRQKDDWVVRAVLTERMQELGPLPIAEAKTRLSKYTVDRLLDIHKRYTPKAEPEQGITDLEGSSPPTRRAVTKPEAQEPTRISDWIREKKSISRERNMARLNRKEAS